MTPSTIRGNGNGLYKSSAQDSGRKDKRYVCSMHRCVESVKNATSGFLSDYGLFTASR